MGQKEVSIKMTSMIQQHGMIDVIHKKYEGKIAQKNNQWFIFYTDEELGKTLLKYHLLENTLSISYESQHHTKWLFSKSEKTQLSYQLPQGMVSLAIQTQLLTFDEKDEQIQLELHYTLQYGREEFGKYQITYTIIH